MHQMPPHPPNPQRIHPPTHGHRNPTYKRNPPKLLRPTQHNRNNILQQLKHRNEAIFNTSKGRALGGRRHSLCELLRGEVEDPEAETGGGEEEEEREGAEDCGG